MDMEQMENGKVDFAFVGSALGLFGRYLGVMLSYLVVIPLPWILAWYLRWCVDNVRMSDNTPIAFVGKGNQIWFPVIAVGIFGFVGNFVPDAWALPFALVDIPLSLYVFLLVLRWFCQNVVISDGPQLSFEGKFLAYCGWSVLMILSVVTVIGWAWVAVAMYRWMCRNVRWRGHEVEFNGTGGQVLWRSLVVLLCSILIIPIPWIALWYTKWLVSMLSVRPVAAYA